MSRSSTHDFELDLSWSSLALESPPATPSWLVPPLESSSFPVARVVVPVADLVANSAVPPLALVPVAPALAPDLEPEEPDGPAYPDLREENAALTARLEQAMFAVAQIRRAILAASEGEMVRLACAVAERVARRELTTDPSIIVGWVREASELLAASDSLTIVLSSDLAASVDEVAFREAISNLATIEIDACLGPMRCEVRTRIARVDPSLEERIAAVAEDLGARHG